VPAMRSKWLQILALVLLQFPASSILAEEAPAESAGIEVMSAFTSAEVEEGEAVAITDETKYLVMFLMGVPLLLLLLATVVLGVAMGVYGKPVFVAHMVCAGLSMTLATAHAVVGLVWFYPF